MKKIFTPLDDEVVERLRSGQQVLLYGKIYTARDAAHKRLIELINQGKDLPFNPMGQIIYYVGPAPAKPGQVIGPAGPTTSGRMDTYTPALLARGLKGTIGKGLRSSEVIKAMQEYKAVYFAAVGGAAALISKCIKQSNLIAYPELGPEAVYELEVENFPLIVVNDAYGGDLYSEGRKKYLSNEINNTKN
ncbi:Fe-S-containing hydro-lyase [Desulfolucanica intricata]|uniref:Fe-S-containing hydro-lyase n=1 Tax=Desulfolucanica intricata TaxID=1285191 RepID=UPI0008322989|nr:Fe-S-containing hydro-lyase [Desulfolucanica intricata]